MSSLSGIDLSQLGTQFSKLGNNAFKVDLKNPNFTAAVGTAFDAVGSFMPTKSVYSGEKGNVAATADSIYDTASDIIGMVPGWGNIASLAMKGNALLSKGVSALGGGTDGMTTVDALLGSNFFQMTPMGLINGFGGRKSHTLENGQSERDTITNVGSAYGGSVGDWQNAMKYSNKKYGAFSSSGRHKANNKVDDANYKMNLMTGISNQARTQLEVANGTADTTDKRYELTLQGGYNPRTRIGRQGLKIEYIKRAKMIANKVKDQNVTKHKEGGKIEEEKFFIPTDWQPLGQLQKFQNGGAVNIIPEGSLHARKHHMENADNLTKKGIPVVDNDGNQQAEIERDEIIFRKEVTDQIEKLAKEGTDEAAIKCGELLTHEIIENTDDKTGLALQIINKFQNGGNIGNPNGKDILDGGFLPEVTVTDKMPSVADALFNVNNITPPNIHVDIPNKKSPTLDSEGFSWTQAAGKAISGISNAINTSKQQKAEYNQKIQQQKDEMIAGTGNMDKNAQMYNQLMNKAQDGEKLPERKYKTYKDWVTYLESTGRKVDPDYDNEGFYNDPDTYFAWQEEEDKNPGKAHMNDKYKLPTYMTFSTDSKYSTPEETGGTWSYDDNGDIFITSPFLESKHSLADYLKWLPIHDSGVKTLIYKGKSYHIGRKK